MSIAEKGSLTSRSKVSWLNALLQSHKLLCVRHPETAPYQSLIELVNTGKEVFDKLPKAIHSVKFYDVFRDISMEMGYKRKKNSFVINPQQFEEELENNIPHYNREFMRELIQGAFEHSQKALALICKPAEGNVELEEDFKNNGCGHSNYVYVINLKLYCYDEEQHKPSNEQTPLHVEYYELVENKKAQPSTYVFPVKSLRAERREREQKEQEKVIGSFSWREDSGYDLPAAYTSNVPMQNWISNSVNELLAGNATEGNNNNNNTVTVNWDKWSFNDHISDNKTRRAEALKEFFGVPNDASKSVYNPTQIELDAIINEFILSERNNNNNTINDNEARKKVKSGAENNNNNTINENDF